MECDYLHPLAIEMLKVADPIFSDLGIDFFIVGAVARNIHLSKIQAYTSKRMTNDIDFAILVGNEEQFYEIKERLLTTGFFTAHSTEAIKVFYKERLEIDLMPFGGIENDEREIELSKPRAFKMDMSGFKELTENFQIITVDGLSFKIASIEVIVMLKLFAWGDRPGRTKDLVDINNICEAYFDLHLDEIYENYFDVFNFFETTNPSFEKLVASRVIGRKIKQILSEHPTLIDRLKEVLDKRPLEEWQQIFAGLNE
jgi:predicted nucleotidyltransferase